MSLPRLSMLLFASAALCSCVGTSPEQEEPKVKKSLSEYMQDNKTNSIANVPTGLLSTTPNQQQATHLTATTQEEMTRAYSGAVYYTDAHDPDAPIPGLEEAFAQRKENERWIQSYIEPRGYLTRPGMDNHAGSHAAEYQGLPALA